jgi:hypothetical protein
MTRSLLMDSKDYPQLFRWNGGVAAAVLDAWLVGRGWTVPPELMEIWTELGGGDIFETETLLQPASDGADDDVDAENEQLISVGLPPELMAFHRGFCTSAIDQSSAEVVALDSGTLREIARFGSMEEWYCQLIRREYADRYRLRPASGASLK